MSAKVSIIMPVYKVEEYVGKSIESMQQQTYQNWELCLADGSDKEHAYVGEIWQEYCQQCGAPIDGTWFETVKQYEDEVLSKRG